MPESIAPAFIKIEYASAYGPHIAMLPTREWTENGGGFDSGSFPRWSDDDPVEADSMVSAICVVLAAFLPDTAAYQRYTIFTLATPTSDPLPRYQAAIVQAGVDATPGWSQAVQFQVNARTEDFGLAKLVLLDAASNNTFDKVTTLGGSGSLFDLMEEWSSDTVAWAGRDGSRPQTFISRTMTLNEKLRRAYRLA